MDKITEAIRVVGHLLETNGTTGRYAVDKRGIEVEVDSKQARKFCLLGAAQIVGVKLKIASLPNHVKNYLGLESGLISFWDNAGIQGRKWAIEQLKSV